ncbi:hypothetical protein B0H14DRAFT_3162160 [Mycena olivaceomarginata]|nr:hypothetical protein B0H14DRAFT_3162160 [Mycena olivaceomarginata]
MSTAHDDWPPSPISSTSLSPASTANFTDSATLEFVNVTKEEAMTGLTSVRADKAHSDDKTSERRRVAHNDVERQRRGDLNRRILDLASLLCMVKPDHRLTRTAILNSVIAHLHAERRHSVLAAQELRMIENETVALRREVNEWRAYAGVTCLDEPVRSEALEAVLCDEFNVLDGVKASAMARDRNSRHPWGTTGRRARVCCAASTGREHR